MKIKTTVTIQSLSQLLAKANYRVRWANEIPWDYHIVIEKLRGKGGPSPAIDLADVEATLKIFKDDGWEQFRQDLLRVSLELANKIGAEVIAQAGAAHLAAKTRKAMLRDDLIIGRGEEGRDGRLQQIEKIKKARETALANAQTCRYHSVECCTAEESRHYSRQARKFRKTADDADRALRFIERYAADPQVVASILTERL